MRYTQDKHSFSMCNMFQLAGLVWAFKAICKRLFPWDQMNWSQYCRCRSTCAAYVRECVDVQCVRMCGCEYHRVYVCVGVRVSRVIWVLFTPRHGGVGFNQKFHYRLITLINLTKGWERKWGSRGQSAVTDVKQKKSGRENLTKKNEEHTVGKK